MAIQTLPKNTSKKKHVSKFLTQFTRKGKEKSQSCSFCMELSEFHKFCMYTADSGETNKSKVLRKMVLQYNRQFEKKNPGYEDILRKNQEAEHEENTV